MERFCVVKRIECGMRMYVEASSNSLISGTYPYDEPSAA
jgi:hypothetical protein